MVVLRYEKSFAWDSQMCFKPDSFSISLCVLRAVVYNLFFPNAEKAFVFARLVLSPKFEPISRSCSPFGCWKNHSKRLSRLPSS